MTTLTIETPTKADYLEIVNVWEASVRATHDFIPSSYVDTLRPMVLNQYLDLVKLRCIRNEAGNIIGFSGVAEDGLEMLFIHPDWRGRGVGKALLKYTIEEQGVTKVDVNEQNEQAVGFYLKMGFKVIGRSALDGQGQPYPLLHMQLNRI